MSTSATCPRRCRRLLVAALLGATLLGPSLLGAGLATAPLVAADQRWQRFGPPATSLFATLTDPSRPDTLLTVTVGGDLYASSDTGRSWSWSASGLPRSAEVSALAADASIPGRIFAAGPRRIYRSDDHGRRWQPISDPSFAPFPAAGPLPYQCLLAVVPDTSPPGTSPPVLLFAGLGLGPIWRSVDGGVHWAAVDDVGPTWYLVTTPEGAVYAGNGAHFWRSDSGGHGFVERFAFGGPEVIYSPAATGDVVYVADGRLVYRSDDRGANFRLVHAAEDFVGIGQLLVDPDDADRVWGARYVSGPFGIEPSIVSSDDGGARWQVTGRGLVHGAVAQLLLAGRPGRVVAQGDTELAVSDDAGLTWTTRVVTGLRHLAVFAANHVRFDRRRPGLIQALVGGRAFASDDTGLAWRPLADRITDGGFGLLYDLAADPVRPGFLWQGGGQGLGTSRNGGATWDPLIGVDVGDVLSLAFPRRNSLLAAGWGLAWSADRGRHWTTADLRGADPAPRRLFDDLVVDPTLPRVVVAHGLVTDLHNGQLVVLGRDSWRSADGGRSFSALPVEPVAFAADGAAYGALTDGNPNGGSQLAVSRNHGASWQAIGAPVDGTFRALAVDPRAPAQMLALLDTLVDRRLLRSTDGGLTWQPADGGLSAYELLLCQRLVADPTTPHRFIVSGQQGLFAATWAP